MDAFRLHVKLDFDPRPEIDTAALVPIFQRWIQDDVLDDLLIDVADYRHVVNGPGVILVAHEANYSVDLSGAPGLRYARKRPREGTFAERLRAGLARAFKAARALAEEPALAGTSVSGDRWTLRIQDRLLAPDSDETFAAVEPELLALLGELYGDAGVTLRREGGGCFGVRVEATQGPGVPGLLRRLDDLESASRRRCGGGRNPNGVR